MEPGSPLEALLERVRAGDPQATLLARDAGVGAAPGLRPLAAHADADVRRIALYCLRETGGPEARAAFLAGLLDGERPVRAAAVAGLDRHFEPSLAPALIETYDAASDPFVKERIALLLGRLPPGQVDLAALAKRRDEERDLRAEEGWLVALARLGDAEARRDFVARLHASRRDARARYLRHCAAIHAPWLVRPLDPVLDDESPMVEVGMDGNPNVPEFLRACDLAVNLVASIAGSTFSFEIGVPIQYGSGQRAEVHRFIQALPEVQDAGARSS